MRIIEWLLGIVVLLVGPLFRWMALFAHSMVGKDFEGGLANLKKVAEKP